MPSIQVLDQNTINQIAAGEVIERPASVVKELLENAIDAKATAVTVEIKDGGISLIRITDNGCGIRQEEISLAFLRHSTSKIRSVEDLLTVSSLGFRGEALSSIASVAQVELITKIPQALNGARYVIEGGQEKLKEEIGCPEGTTFLVRNLFYNTPARRKFLKTAQTEAGYISEIVERIALSHPEISIRFINNNQNKLHTSGNSSQKDVIYQVYGREITANLLSIKKEANFGGIEGYIGKPLISRGNRSFENYYVNGRYIRSQLIAKAVEEAYQPYLMQHKYPFVVFNLSVRSELLDINVHPAKLELRFRSGQEIYDFIKTAVSQALEQKELIPEITLGATSRQAQTAIAKKPVTQVFRQDAGQKEPSEHVAIKQGGIPCPTRGAHDSMAANFPTRSSAESAEGSPLPASRRAPEPFESRRMEMEAVKESAGYPVYPQPDKEKEPEQMALPLELLSEEAKPLHRIIGQLFGTYWLVQLEDKLFFIDQHAAHEKVLYERMVKRFQNRDYASQLLNPPVIVTLDLKQESLFLQNKAGFEQIGFEIEPFGGREYAISAVPDQLFGLIGKDVFLEILDQLSEEWKGGTQPSAAEKLASMSCRAAVKGNHSLSEEEAGSLIDQLLELENPYHCPHGRPTIIAMTKAEIERKFKRIL